MRILLISSFLPFPLYSGGHIRLYNLLKHLSSKHEITLICEKRAYQIQEDIEAVKKITKKVITINRKKQWTFLNIVKTGFTSNPFLITGHSLPKLQEAIAQEISASNFDLIHCETSYVFQNIHKTSIPIVLVEHNLEYQIYKLFTQSTFSLLRPLLTLDVIKLKKQEERFWKKAQAVVAVSIDEKKEIEKYNNKVFLVPNGVDLDAFQLKKFEKRNNYKTVLFIGDFSYLQNKDSARFIINDIWPKIISKMPQINVRLQIVGRVIPGEIKKLDTTGNIIFEENATRPTADIFSNADLLLAPIRVGGGTQYKILEAMAVGTPVVTTSIGAEGIEAKNKKEIIIADTANDLSDEVVNILANDAYYKSIALDARALIEEKYSWDIIANELDRVYKMVIKK